MRSPTGIREFPGQHFWQLLARGLEELIFDPRFVTVRIRAGAEGLERGNIGDIRPKGRLGQETCGSGICVRIVAPGRRRRRRAEGSGTGGQGKVSTDFAGRIDGRVEVYVRLALLDDLPHFGGREGSSVRDRPLIAASIRTGSDQSIA